MQFPECIRAAGRATSNPVAVKRHPISFYFGPAAAPYWTLD
jgi:hypothetical protein